MHAKIENGAVAEYPIQNLRDRLPDVSLPSALSDDSALPEGYVYVRPAAFPQFDPATQRVIGVGPVRNGDHWEQGYEVVSLTQTELDEQAQQRAAQTAEARRQAYQTEADPLFFKAQRGEATMDDWLAKVAEIKTRFA